MVYVEKIISKGKVVTLPNHHAEVTLFYVVKLQGKHWVDQEIDGANPRHLKWAEMARDAMEQNSAPLRLVEACTGLCRDATSAEDVRNLQLTDEDARLYAELTFKYDKSYCKDVITTKEFVDAALKANRGNRPVATSHIRELGNTFRNGRYCPTGQGLTFDVTGRLNDGQQRLMTFRAMGYPKYKMTVRYDCPVMSRIFVDSHLLSRRTIDHLRFVYGLTDLTVRMCAAARCSLGWIFRTETTSLPATSIEAPELYSWILERTRAHATIGGVRKVMSLPAPIIGAFIDRWHESEDDRIVHMLQLVLEKPCNAPENKAVWALRDFIARWKGKLSGGWTSQRMRYYAATETILSFLEGDRKNFDAEMLDNAAKTLTLKDVNGRMRCIMRHHKKPTRKWARSSPASVEK